jgi:hypothetical protein
MLADTSKLRKRVRRAARSVRQGLEILDRLDEPDARALLVEGADESVPSVSKVASLLVDDFTAAVMSQPPVKTLVGMAVRAILAEEGYERVERGVRTDRSIDTVFSTGSVYAKIEPDDEPEELDGQEELIELLVAVGEKLLGEGGRRQLVARLEASYD